MNLTPFQHIQQFLTNKIPDEIIKEIPRKWEKIGTILVVKLLPSLEPYADRIGEGYARILDCEAVLVDTGGIFGKYREPLTTHVYGKKNTETMHQENGISFFLDPQKIMFSSGNMDERIRMGSISNPSETVVDLFAGIGYFTIPMAVYSKPENIYACEIKPSAYVYLLKNIEKNKVSKTVEPLLGDSKIISPKNVADRVIMGYFHDTRSYLNTAIECLNNHCGIVHYQDIFPDLKIPQTPLDLVQAYCTQYNRIAHLGYYHRIKSYAPGISHYVFDIEIREENK